MDHVIDKIITSAESIISFLISTKCTVINTVTQKTILNYILIDAAVMHSLEERKRKRVIEDEKDCGMFPSKASVISVLSQVLGYIIISTPLIKLIILYHEEYPTQQKCNYLVLHGDIIYTSVLSDDFRCYNCRKVSSFNEFGTLALWMRKCTPVDLEGLQTIKYKIICLDCSYGANIEERRAKLGIVQRSWVSTKKCAIDMITSQVLMNVCSLKAALDESRE